MPGIKWNLPTCRWKLEPCDRKTHRFGLCSKHRKYIEKGYFDVDLNQLKPLPYKPSYNGCKMEGCEEKHRRNGFCRRHDEHYKRGSIDIHGNRLIPERLNPPGATCKVCSDGNSRIVKGFCHKHYTAFKRGRLTIDGRPTSLIRLSRFRCVMCRARVRLFKKPDGLVFFCNQGCKEDYERKKLREANPAPKPKPKMKPLPMNKKKCKVPGCQSKGYAKSLCTKHYNRFKNGSPLTDEAFFTNKGKACEVETCELPAKCRGYCNHHYWQLVGKEARKKVNPERDNTQQVQPQPNHTNTGVSGINGLPVQAINSELLIQKPLSVSIQEPSYPIT